MKIYDIPYRDNFLEKIAEFIILQIKEKSPEFILNSLIVLPTRYSCRTLIELIKRRLSSNLLLPRITSISGSTAEGVDSTILEKLILSDIIKNSETYKSVTFSSILNIVDEIYSLITELEIGGINSVDTNTYIENDFLKTLTDIKNDFKNRLQQLKLTWSATTRLTHIKSLISYVNQNNCLNIIAGVATFNKFELELLSTVYKHSNGYIFTHNAKYNFDFDDVKQKMFSALDISESDIEYLNNEENQTPPQVNFIEVSKQYSVPQIVALITKETLIKNPKERIAIITNNFDSEKQIKTALERWSIYARRSAYDKLSESQFGCYSILVAEFLFKEHSTFNMMAILNNKFSKIDPTVFKTLDLFVKYQRFIPKNYLKILNNPKLELTNEIIEHFKNIDFEGLAKLSSMRDICAAHIEFIKKIAEPPKTFLSQINFLLSSEDIIGKISPSEYPSIFRKILDYIPYKRRTTLYNKEVRIIGRIEAKLMKFNTVIFTDFNDEKMPGKLSNTFLSDVDRSNLGLITNKLHTSLSFVEFIQHTFSNRCFVIRNVFDKNKTMIKSRFLTALEKQQRIAVNYYFPNLYEAMCATKYKGPCKRPMPIPPVALRPKKLSVTEIGNLMRNPYFIYAKHILGLRPLNEFNIGYLHAIKGQLIHKMVDIFISNCTQNISADLDEIAQKAMNKLLLDPADLGFWMVKLKDLKSWFLDAIDSISDNVKHSYSEINGNITFNIKGHEFTLLCLADRIDWLKDDTISIIDYKTGVIPSMRDILAGFSPQLYLEGVIATNGGFFKELPQKVSKIEVWRMNRANNSEVIPIAKHPDKAISICAKGFKMVIEKFFDEKTPYIPYPRSDVSINSDPYYHLARVQEWMF